VEVSRAAEIDSARLRRMQADLLQAAQTAFEEAIQANPYDDATRSRLAQVYRLRGERLGQEQAYDKAIEMYEKLARLQQDSPSLFVALANLYYDTEQYRESAVNYRKARKAYVTSVELSLEDSTQVDSTRLYQYAQAEANAYRFARNAERALAAYREAKAVAATSAQRTTMQNWIDWVNWDDGNISASFARDSLKGLAAEGKAEAAAEGFRSLKARLQTASARYEVDWRLAQAEYQMGKRKQAADRMQRLVNQLDVKGDGTPADSSHQRYLDAYGTICLNMGRRMRREDLRAALKYYKQSAEVAWERRSLAELEVGRLLRNDVEASIRYLERALSRDGTLETENQLRLYRTLVNQHRRLGHREEARTYRKKYMALRRKASAGR
jgi:tetratricopeptide (TPR) repeat protein